VACFCAAGFKWDILSFTCVPNSCIDTSCVTCAGLPGTSSSLLIPVVGGEPTMQFSGDVEFSSQASASSPLYTTLASFKCQCILGYTWSIPRRRCFKSTASTTY
jgi:hypothetical protein